MANKNLASVDKVQNILKADSLLAEIGGDIKRIEVGKLLHGMGEENMFEDYYAYGIQINTASSSPTLLRIGNSDLHRRLPVQSRMKACLLDDDGNVVKYLDPTSWVNETRDGSQGQVMVELPEHYRKFVTDGDKLEVWISEYPLPGYHKVKKSYMSAYEAALDRTNLKLASVVNTTTQYRGGGNPPAWDGTYRSQLGMPATSLTRTQFRSYARKRKTGSTQWNCLTYEQHKTLYWLFTIEYATLNSQAAFNAQKTAEGYRRGGLGDGVTAMPDWENYNSFNPIIPCGVTDSLGNNSGIVNYAVKNANNETIYTAPVPRYRGIENPFGHIWKNMDGVNVRVSPNVADGGDGLSKVFTCANPALFNDSNYEGYTYIGDNAREQSFIKKIIFGEYGSFIPSICTGGSSSSYYCDGHYVYIPPTTVALRTVLVGDRANLGADCGFVAAATSRAPSGAGASVGSRLCFIA